MKCFALALTLCLAVPSALFAQEHAVPEIPFDSVPNFLKLPPKLYLGEEGLVAIAGEGEPEGVGALLIEGGQPLDVVVWPSHAEVA